MFDWFYDTFNYFFQDYKTKNDKVIKELHSKFNQNSNTKCKAEREPLITDLRHYFILNGVRRNAEAKSKLIRCNQVTIDCDFCPSKKAVIDLQSYTEIIENKWYLIGGDDSDLVDNQVYHCLFAGPFNKEEECEFFLNISHVFKIRGSEIMRFIK